MKLDSEKIKSLLDFEAEVMTFETVGSTNIIAEKIAEEHNLPVIIAAEEQTDGRGRNGKSFFSPETGLYFSFLTHPETTFLSFATVTCGTAVAVCRAIEKLTGLHPQIKWVNDIFFDGRKVCGILCRALGGNGRVKHLITGVGINISTPDFPDEIKETAGSLNVRLDKNVLLAETVNQIMSLSAEDYMDEYRRRSCVLGREITYYINSVAYTGIAVGIDDGGGLIVEKDGERKTLTGGEITVRFAVD